MLAVNIAEALDKVSHTGVLYKENKNERISEELLTWLRDYLSHRSLRVMVNEHVSSTFKIAAGYHEAVFLAAPLF